MKVFACYHTDKPIRCFGYIIACGNSKEEAFNAAMNDARLTIYAYKEQAYPFKDWYEIPIITDKIYPRLLCICDPTV